MRLALAMVVFYLASPKPKFDLSGTMCSMGPRDTDGTGGPQAR